MNAHIAELISLKYANGLRNGANSDTHRCKQLTEHGEERCIKLREVAGFSAVRTIFQIVGPRKILHCLLKISKLPANEPFILLANGKLIGEGFDLEKLDTVIFSFPFSWKAVVTQYIGRVMRRSPSKKHILLIKRITIRRTIE